MKPLFLFLFSLCLVTAHAQIRATPVPRASIPRDLDYKGEFLDALSWTDKDGEHLVLRTEERTATLDEGMNAELHAYHFRYARGMMKKDWEVRDSVKACEVDWVCHFIRPSFGVTDLDGDGRGEVWLMYRTGCFGDVGPTTQKIIMYQGGKKYALRGETKAVLGGQNFGGGKAEMDAALRAAPAALRNYATTLWKTYEMEFGHKKEWLGLDE